MPRVIALVDDLMFVSRIREAARGGGADVSTVRTVADLVASSREASLVLVDLDSPRLPVRAALQALQAEAQPGLPVIGFFSHVEVDRAREAAALGCTKVLPRSAFVRELPGLLAALG